jgi:hypothetical protein
MSGGGKEGKGVDGPAEEDTDDELDEPPEARGVVVVSAPSGEEVSGEAAMEDRGV